MKALLFSLIFLLQSYSYAECFVRGRVNKFHAHTDQQLDVDIGNLDLRYNLTLGPCPGLSAARELQVMPQDQSEHVCEGGKVLVVEPLIGTVTNVCTINVIKPL